MREICICIPTWNRVEMTLNSFSKVYDDERIKNLIIVDEASLHLDIDSQMEKRKDNKPLFALCALCRHAGLDLYFLAQHSKNVDAKLRRLCSKKIHCIKTASIPFIGWFLASIPFFGTFSRTIYTGESSEADGRTWHKFDPLVGSAYRTHGMRSALHLKESPNGIVKQGTEFSEARGKKLAIAIVLLLCGIFSYSYFSGQKLYNKYAEEKPKAKAESDTVNSMRQHEPAPKQSKLAALSERNDVLKYSGFIMSKSGYKIYLDTGDQISTSGSYLGQLVTDFVYSADWFYVHLENGEKLAIRPKTAQEKEQDRHRNDKKKERTLDILGTIQRP